MERSLRRRHFLRLGGLAGGTLLTGAVGNGLISAAPVAAAGSFSLNGFTVDEPFASYWQNNGGLAQQGLPISNRFSEVSPTNGKSYDVQYFERARFEYHPENQPPYDVLLGLLGSEQFKAKYPNGQPGAPPPPPPPLHIGETLHVDGVDMTVTIDGAALDSSGGEIDFAIVYSNTSGGSQDFTVMQQDLHLSDDAGGTWTFNGNSSPKRFIIDPGKQARQIYPFTSKDGSSDRHLTLMVTQFGKVHNASWVATLSQGHIE